MRRSLFLLIVSAAACSSGDTITESKPFKVIKPPHALPLLAESPAQPAVTTFSQLSVPTLTDAPPNLAQQNYCFSNLGVANYHNVSDQSQILRWDDTTHLPRREIIAGRLKIYWTYWAGTYINTPVQCIVLDSVRAISTAYEYNVVLDTVHWTAYPRRWNYCSGGNCDARIRVTAQFRFGRNCFIDSSNGYSEQYILGGNPILIYNDPQSLIGAQWAVDIFAVSLGRYAWWTVQKYGGSDSPYTNGFPGGRDVCSRWSPGTNNFWFWQRSGHATWSVQSY